MDGILGLCELIFFILSDRTRKLKVKISVYFGMHIFHGFQRIISCLKKVMFKNRDNWNVGSLLTLNSKQLYIVFDLNLSFLSKAFKSGQRP